MNVQFEFAKRDTFLIESDAASIWNEEETVAHGERRLYVISGQTAVSPSMEASVRSGILESIVDTQRRCLLVAQHWGAAIAASASSPGARASVDIETLWGETAPLPPTAVLSACFSTLPLQNAVVTEQSADAGSVGTKYSLIFPFTSVPLFASRSHPLMSTHRGLFWESFLSVLHSVCFNDVDYHTNPTAAPSRFSLQSYMDRAHHSGTQRGATNTTQAWPEELLWKLLNSLLSCLAFYQTSGLHFDGQLTALDVMCFSAPTSLALSMNDTMASLRDDSRKPWSATEKQIFVKTVSTSITLPQAFIEDTTPAASAFFVVMRMPLPLATTELQEVIDSAQPASPGDELRAHQRDLATVGHLMSTIISQRGGEGAVSPELQFLVSKMVACAGDGAEATATNLSAMSLCQLQALRLRSALWLSKMEADEYNARLQWAQMARPDPPSARNDDRDLVAREAAMARKEAQLHEREEKFNVLLELYELTTTQLDSLPESRSAAFRALRHRLESLSGSSVPAPASTETSTVTATDVSVPLDVSPVNPATPHARSTLDGSLFAKESVRPETADAAPLGLPFTAAAGAPGIPLDSRARGASRRNSNSVYESEATLSSPSLSVTAAAAAAATAASVGLRETAARPSSLHDAAVTVELTAETEESDNGTGYSGIEDPSTLHTPLRQRLSPAKDMHTGASSAKSARTSPATAWQTDLGATRVTPAADSHTPTRPAIPSLGKDDLSSQSKYTSIYMGGSGGGGGSGRGHGVSGSASRHLHFDPPATAPTTTASADRPSRQRSNSSTGGRRSPRVKTDDHWIQQQYDTLEGLRRSFSVHSSATRPSLREGSASSQTQAIARSGVSVPPPPAPQLGLSGEAIHADSVMHSARYSSRAGAAGGAAAALPSPVIERVSPVHTPSHQRPPWRTPLSATSSASRPNQRPGTAPSTTSARVGAAPPSVQLNTPDRPRQAAANGSRPTDGTMDLLQRLRATL